jgi:hypothetical protein
MVEPKFKTWDIETSYFNNLVVAGEFNKRVSVWNASTGEKISEIETLFDFGGRRFAISPKGNRVAAGAYDGSYLNDKKRYGGAVALYNIDDGREIWKRKDIKRIQKIKFGGKAYQDRILTFFSDQACQALRISDGTTEKKLRNAEWIVESPRGDIQYIQGHYSYRVLDTSTGKRLLHRDYFFTMTADYAAFTNEGVVIMDVREGDALDAMRIKALLTAEEWDKTEIDHRWVPEHRFWERRHPQEGIALHSLDGMVEKWRFKMPNEEVVKWKSVPFLYRVGRFVDLGYCEKTREIVCVYRKMRPDAFVGQSLVYLDERDGGRTREITLETANGRWGSHLATRFASEDKLLIANDGSVYDVASGEKTRTLPFQEIRNAP